MHSDALILKVSVQDEGIGMSENEIENLFTPFCRSANMTSRNLNPNGHGLGLYICKKICQNLGGGIEVTSRVGIGSTFTFTITAFLGGNHYS